MASKVIYEFDTLVSELSGLQDADGQHVISQRVFDWLELRALRATEASEPAWLRLTQRSGHRAVQVTSYVGVVRTPDGYQIEVLPKIGKATSGGEQQARSLLVEMLRCLGGFRHVRTDSAKIMATRMQLFEVFIGEFLLTVKNIVKHGLRGDYSVRQENVFALRGKLMIASHLRLNMCRRDRLFAEFDEFTTNRPENRLLHAALRRVLAWTASQEHQQLARELCFVFSEVPASKQPKQDFLKVRMDRGMSHYADALSWARLILGNETPLTGAGDHLALSLLFPMELVFEAYVAKHLARQLTKPFKLKTQVRKYSLVTHLGEEWFLMKPDLVVQEAAGMRMVMDTKWKLLDNKKARGTDKYGLSQGDLYQLHAYGQSYLNGEGEVVLIYPRTATFDEALDKFIFPKSKDLRLWVLPFCLDERRLILPRCASLNAMFYSY